MSTHFPTFSLSSSIPYLWAPPSLGEDRRPSTYADNHDRGPRKRAKLLASLQNRGTGLQRAGDSLSDDEAELEDQAAEIRNFGYSWMVPTGRHTSQEDEADAFIDAAEHDEASPGPRPTVTHPLLGAAARPRDQPAVEDEPASDLDADVEDMDAPNTSGPGDASRDQENQGETTEDEA